MAFLQEPENASGPVRGDRQLPRRRRTGIPSTVTSPTDQQMLEWLGEKSTAWWAANYTPVDLDVNGTFVVFQKMMADEIDAARLGSALPGRDHEMARGESRRGRELPVMARLLSLLGTAVDGAWAAAVPSAAPFPCAVT